jgi:hypothetical protein
MLLIYRVLFTGYAAEDKCLEILYCSMELTYERRSGQPDMVLLTSEGGIYHEEIS